MTTTTPTYKVPSRELWNTMPGWGIAADLTPPELLATRKLRKTIREVLIGLGFLAGLIVIGFAFALIRHHTASSEVNAAQRASDALLADQHKYQNVVQIRGTISQIDGQLTGLMSNDTDVPALLAKLDGLTPPGVAITQIDLTLNAPGISETAPGGGVSLDTSGKATIGTFTLQGAGVKITDGPAYTDKLKGVPGLINVYLGSNTQAPGGSSFEITAALTNDLLTHRYSPNAQAPKPKAGK